MTSPGLQPERTRLAWQRTALAAAACALLLLHGAVHGGRPLAALPAALAGGCAVAMATVGWFRSRQLRRGGPPAAAPALLGTIAVVVLATAVTALVTLWARGA